VQCSGQACAHPKVLYCTVQHISISLHYSSISLLNSTAQYAQCIVLYCAVLQCIRMQCKCTVMPLSYPLCSSCLISCTSSNGQVLSTPLRSKKSYGICSVTSHHLCISLRLHSRVRPQLLLLLLQIRTQPHLGCCLAAATAAASAIFMHLCTNSAILICTTAVSP
jgi:hypothetical protein